MKIDEIHSKELKKINENRTKVGYPEMDNREYFIY